MEFGTLGSKDESSRKREGESCREDRERQGDRKRKSRESKREQGRPLTGLTGGPWTGCKTCDLGFARKMASGTQKAPTLLLPGLALDSLLTG